MPTAIHQKIRDAHLGKCPQAILQLTSGWVMLGDVQPLTGYCVLFSDPVARDLNSLSEKDRMQYCLDMTRVGDALLQATGAYRINYETWCNLDPALHTHIVPRFMHEPNDKRILPSRMAYDWKNTTPFDLTRDLPLMQKLRDILAPFAKRL